MEGPMPLYFFLPVVESGSLTPSLRQTSATATPVTACCGANTIRDSVNFDLFIAIYQAPILSQLPCFFLF
jgi:hypothetical protein